MRLAVSELEPIKEEQMADVQRAKIAYWRERRDAMKARVDDLRRAYTEARDAGANEEELQRIRRQGEALAERVKTGDRMIAEEEARLASENEESQA